MLIGGAGGHAMEVRDELEKKHEITSFDFYVDAEFNQRGINQPLSVIANVEALQVKLKNDPRFVLGVGSPMIREKFHSLFEKNGGRYHPVHSITAQISSSASGSFDAMSFSFVGPRTLIGIGVLINVRASVHHDSQIGDFSEIGPGTIILGSVVVGKKCRIGAGAVILPGVHLGDEVIVGAGAVVTRDFSSHSKVAGVPAKPLPLKD